MGEVREGPMRLLVLTTAYTMLLIATPAAAQDCAAIQAACVAQCRGGAGATAHSNAVTGVVDGMRRHTLRKCVQEMCLPRRRGPTEICSMARLQLIAGEDCRLAFHISLDERVTGLRGFSDTAERPGDQTPLLVWA